MEIHQLRYAAALARQLHFQRAAQECHVSQPTLSQQLQKLERELGTPLFERSSSGVKLTEAGRAFLPQALAALEILDQAAASLAQDAKEIRGKVRLAAIPTIGPYFLPALITEIRKSAPHLALELYEETTPVLLEHLKEGRLDLGILSLPVADSGIVGRVIGKEKFFAGLSRLHPLAAKKNLTRAEIAREPLLILQEGHCFSVQALEYCKKSREDAQIIFQGSSLASVMKLAAAGQGITFVPEMAARADAPKDLRLVPFSGVQPEREIGVVWRVSAPLQKAHMFLIETAARTFKNLRSAG